MQKFIAWAESRRELWLDCVRIYLGLGLLVRGLLLITGDVSDRYFIDLMRRSDQSWLATGFLMHYVMIAHFVGGIMLTLGFMTRLAAAVQIPVLAGAVFLIHRKEGLLSADQSLEFSALVLFMLGVIFVSGAGKLSLDYVTFGAGRTKAADDADALPQV